MPLPLPRHQLALLVVEEIVRACAWWEAAAWLGMGGWVTPRGLPLTHCP